MTTYGYEVEVGTRLFWEGEPATVTEKQDVPMTEEDYYMPARPDRCRITLEFDDGTVDEVLLWETDEVVLMGDVVAMGLCPRCGGPLTIDPADPAVGIFEAAVYCENVLPDGRNCFWGEGEDEDDPDHEYDEGGEG